MIRRLLAAHEIDHREGPRRRSRRPRRTATGAPTTCSWATCCARHELQVWFLPSTSSTCRSSTRTDLPPLGPDLQRSGRGDAHGRAAAPERVDPEPEPAGEERQQDRDHQESKSSGSAPRCTPATSRRPKPPTDAEAQAGTPRQRAREPRRSGEERGAAEHAEESDDQIPQGDHAGRTGSSPIKPIPIRPNIERRFPMAGIANAARTRPDAAAPGRRSARSAQAAWRRFLRGSSRRPEAKAMD